MSKQETKNEIWKFELEVMENQQIAMPEGAEILSVQVQRGKPYLATKFTRGKLDVADYLNRQTGARSLAVWKVEEKIICLLSPKGSETEEDMANGKLFSVAHELFDQCEEIVETLKLVLHSQDIQGAFRELIEARIIAIELLLKKATT